MKFDVAILQLKLVRGVAHAKARNKGEKNICE
jgi:hypothetical protein